MHRSCRQSPLAERKHQPCGSLTGAAAGGTEYIWKALVSLQSSCSFTRLSARGSTGHRRQAPPFMSLDCATQSSLGWGAAPHQVLRQRASALGRPGWPRNACSFSRTSARLRSTFDEHTAQQKASSAVRAPTEAKRSLSRSHQKPCRELQEARLPTDGRSCAAGAVGQSGRSHAPTTQKLCRPCSSAAEEPSVAGWLRAHAGE